MFYQVKQLFHIPAHVIWVICSFLYQFVKISLQSWHFNCNLLNTFSLRIITKDFLYYIKKSGLINSKYMSENSYLLQNDHFYLV